MEDAVQMLDEQEEWLSANRADIRAKIDEGYAAAQRGEPSLSLRLRVGGRDFLVARTAALRQSFRRSTGRESAHRRAQVVTCTSGISRLS